MGFSFSWNETVGHHATSLDLELTLEAQGEGRAGAQRAQCAWEGVAGAARGCVCTLHPFQPRIPGWHQRRSRHAAIVGLGQGLVASQANSV